MLDWVPPQGWLLLIIGLIVWPWAVVVRRRLQLSRLDSRYPDDRNFRVSLVAVGLAVATSIFIFTPVAKEFARSGYLVPALVGALAAFCLYEATKGVLTGLTDPLMNNLGPYARERQPVRFWLSISSYAAFGILAVWLLVDTGFYIPNEA